MWTILGFGKHSDKTLPQIIFSDPDWFFWAYKANVFDNKGTLKREAEEIYQKATHIKIPEKYGEDMEIEYIMQVSNGTFVRMEIVKKSQPLHTGSSPTTRSKYMNLSFPCQLKSYDKTGGKLIINDMKYYVFGSKASRITKEKAETFFANDSNFSI